MGSRRPRLLRKELVKLLPELRSSWRPPQRGGAARWAVVGGCIGALLTLLAQRLHGGW